MMQSFSIYLACPHYYLERQNNRQVKIKEHLTEYANVFFSRFRQLLAFTFCPHVLSLSVRKEQRTPRAYSILSSLSLCKSPVVQSHITLYKKKINHHLMRQGCEKRFKRTNLEAPIRPIIMGFLWGSDCFQVQMCEKDRGRERMSAGQKKRKEKRN